MRRQITRVLMATALLAAGAVGLSIPPQPSAASAKAPYTSPEHDFSVAFPTTPKVDGHPARNQDAPAYWTYSAEHGGGLFLVRVDQYPAGIPVPAPTPRIYHLLLSAHAMDSSSRLVSAESVAIGAFPAAQGAFTGQDGAIEKRRVVMAGHRLYQIAYTHAERAGIAAVGDAFLASFKIPG